MQESIDLPLLDRLLLLGRWGEGGEARTRPSSVSGCLRRPVLCLPLWCNWPVLCLLAVMSSQVDCTADGWAGAQIFPERQSIPWGFRRGSPSDTRWGCTDCPLRRSFLHQAPTATAEPLHRSGGSAMSPSGSFASGPRSRGTAVLSGSFLVAEGGACVSLGHTVGLQTPCLRECVSATVSSAEWVPQSETPRDE